MKALLCLVVVLAVAGCGEQVRGDLGATLECGGGPTVSMIADHDGITRETRSPRELARSLAEHEKGSFRGDQRVAFDSADLVEIAVTNEEGRTTAIMSYQREPELGWRLLQAVSCAG